LRKSPIRHRVRQHTRNGDAVQSYDRGAFRERAEKGKRILFGSKAPNVKKVDNGDVEVEVLKEDRESKVSRRSRIRALKAIAPKSTHALPNRDIGCAYELDERTMVAVGRYG